MLRRASPYRPTDPPPYPGRSIIINYDISDPMHWKNKQEKKLQVTPAAGDEKDERSSSSDGRHNASIEARHRHPSVASPASSGSGGSSTNEQGNCGSPPAVRPSPVAAGAILTLGELKRKQMHKRRCKLAASGVVNYAEEGSLSSDSGGGSVMRNRDGEEEDVDVDRAEVSLELRLRRLIQKENLSMDSYPAVDYRFAPTTSFDTPDPETILHPLISPLSDVSGELPHTMRPPSGMAPNIPCQQPPPKPPRSVRGDTSKFHVYGIPSPATGSPYSSSGRYTPHGPIKAESKESISYERNQQETDMPHYHGQKAPQPVPRSRSRSASTGTGNSLPQTYNGQAVPSHLDHSPADRHCSKQQPLPTQARNLIPHCRNYPSVTPPLPPVSPDCENDSCSGESPPAVSTGGGPHRGTGYWEVQPERPSLGSGAEPLPSECDRDSTSGEARAASSDEGFCGNSDTASSDDLARKQVLLMCDMQMQLLKALGGAAAAGERTVHREKREAVPTRASSYARLPYVNLYENLPEWETQQRCEMLEDHIGTLARNIEYLTDEIQNQQATLRQLQRDPGRTVRFAQDLEEQTVPRARMNSYSESMVSPPRRSAALPSDRLAPAHQPAVERTETMFSNPERVTKLTKFFGSEPPLVRLFLKKLGYEKYARLFELEKVGLNELPYMTEDRLRRLGIPMGPRTRILREAQLVGSLHADSGFV